VDVDAHQIIDLLPDRQAETAAAWMAAHPQITHVSRDRGAQYESRASTGAPQAVQVADRFHVCKNLSEAVQRCLSRVFSEMRAGSQAAGKEAKVQEGTAAPVEEWRPDPGAYVARTTAIHRAQRDARYQQAVGLHEQGLTIHEIACRLGVHERTVRHWFQRGVAPDVRPPRKRQSDFDP
jgi:DNA-directed RNA polymerase specialized sigma24 family protein